MKKSDRKRTRDYRGLVRENPRPTPTADKCVLKEPVKPDAVTGLSLNLKNKPGRCRVCGAAFMGPSNQKYCPEHSASIKYRGKN
jgi:hypothetical protein